MRNQLTVDDQLLEQAVDVGGHSTLEEAVDEALREYIQRHQSNVFQLFGTIELDPAPWERRQEWRER